MFQASLGAALVVLVACVLASASFGAEPPLTFRAAAQITGWLCISAIVLDLWATALRTGGLRNLPRPTFGQAFAGLTTLFTGALVLYMSYFEWSEFRAVPIRQAAAAVVAQEPLAYKIVQLPRGMPDASFTPAVVHLPKAAARPARQLVASATQLEARDDSCSSLGAFWRLLCHEQVRVAYCADRQGTDPACPSAIPPSPPY